MKGRNSVRSITPVEIIVTMISIGWTIVMFSNPEALATSSWEILRDISSRWVVGSITLFFALIKIVGIYLNSLALRKIGLLASAVLWSFISVSNGASDEHFTITTGFVVYFGIAVLCLWTSKEIAYDRD